MKYNNSVVSFVSTLLFCSGPPAIGGFVIAIIVNTIKRFSVGLVAHVCKEVLKLQPPLANLNPTTTIVFPQPVFLACAPVTHVAPQGPFFGYMKLASHSMLKSALAFTAAALALASDKRRLKYRDLFCAYALTKPFRSANAMNHKPVTKGLTSYIYECRHNFNSIMVNANA